MYVVLGQIALTRWEVIDTVEDRREADRLAEDSQDKYRQIIIVNTEEYAETGRT